MTMRSWLRNVFARPATRPIRRARRTRLGVETLEDRTVPSTILESTATPLVNLPAAGSGHLSGVISDPTDPARALGIDFTIDDPDVPEDGLTVTAISSNQAVVPDADLQLTGSGAARNLKITPAGVGYADITVTVSGGASPDSYVIHYAASAASATPTATRAHTDASDASAAVAVDSDYMFVADDEDQKLRLYDRNNSGLPVNSFDVTGDLGLTDIDDGVPREVDVEGAARVGNRIFWVASGSNSSEGKLRPNRNRIFATDISGSGAAATLTFVGRYDFLKNDLIAWDEDNRLNGRPFLGLAASAAKDVIPETADGRGFNIEGVVFKPGEPMVAYLAFRAPKQTTSTRDKALIVPVTNFATLAVSGAAAGSATFGDPIQLSLGGRGIRDIASNGTDLVIVAGAASSGPFALYTWTGNPADAPVLRAADLTGLNPEAIVEVPGTLTSATQLQLLSDNGDTIHYGDSTIAKELPHDEHTKFRSDVITLGGAVPVAQAGTLTTIQGAAATGTLVANDPDSASLTYSLVDTSNAHGTVTLTDPSTGAYSYTPDADFSGSASFTFKANDGTADGNTATVTITVTVKTPLATVVEDNRNPAGVSVESLLSSFVTDADPGALRGIAITSVAGAAEGTWQYSLNGGRKWINMGAVSATHARLLRGTNHIRFVPAPNFNGQSTLRYAGWDQTAGQVGGFFDLSLPGSTGGARAFSSADRTAFVTVTATNDRPVLDVGGAPGLSRVLPGDADPAGNTVAQVLGASVTDVDTAAQGIAVSLADSTPRTGKWQYQLQGGGWLDVGKIPTGRVLLLRSEDSIRFVPAAGFSGAVKLSYRAWDQTAGTAGSMAVPSGTAFSLATETASLMVTLLAPPVNQAPILDNAGEPPATTTPEDSRTSRGVTVDHFLGNSVTDGDVGALRGIALIGLTGSANGSWQYSLNGGKTWLSVRSVSDDSALLLRGSDRLRFVPLTDFIGDVTITYRAWDRTRGSAGARANLGLGGTGGETPFSGDVETATLTVLPGNDRPVLNTAPLTFLSAIPPGAPDSMGNMVVQLLGSVTDVDAGAQQGIAVSLAVSSARTGKWQYRSGLDWFAGWKDVGTIPAGKVLLLDAADGIRFLPVVGFRGTVKLSYRAWDQTTGTARTLAVPAGTAFSLATETATVINSTGNDRPIINPLVKPALLPVLPDSGPSAEYIVSNVTAGAFLDLDPVDQLGIAIIGVSTGGSWEYSENGVDWTAVSGVGVKTALLLRPADLLRFVPNAGFRGKATLSYRAWDGTSGAFGTPADVTVGTAFSLATATVAVVVNTAPVLTV